MASEKRPGVMVFFDALPSLELMDIDGVGRLFLALLRYGFYGEEPDLTGPERLVWPFLQAGADRGAESYTRRSEENRLKGEYSSYKRDAKGAGQEPLSYADWLTLASHGQPELATASRGEPTKLNESEPNQSKLNESEPIVNVTSGQPVDNTTPTKDDILSFCQEKGLTMQDIDGFIRFNGERCWRKPWRDAVRLWIARERPKSTASEPPVPTRTSVTAEQHEATNRLLAWMRSQHEADD